MTTDYKVYCSPLLTAYVLHYMFLCLRLDIIVNSYTTLLRKLVDLVSPKCQCFSRRLLILYPKETKFTGFPLK